MKFVLFGKTFKNWTGSSLPTVTSLHWAVHTLQITGKIKPIPVSPERALLLSKPLPFWFWLADCVKTF